MKIKDCLSCRMNEQRVIKFIPQLSINVYEQESFRDAWQIYIDTAECDGEEADYPQDFLEHILKDHEVELDDLVQDFIGKQAAVMGKFLKRMEKIVKEVF